LLNQKQPNKVTMQKPKPIINIEETQKIDKALLIQLAKLLERLPNMED
jgi:hypothetical protein